MNLVSRYEKILTKPKTLVRQKLVTKKFGCSQTQSYYTQQYYKAQTLLSGVVKNVSIKKVWMRGMKAGWNATPTPTYNNIMTHISVLKTLVTKNYYPQLSYVVQLYTRWYKKPHYRLNKKRALLAHLTAKKTRCYLITSSYLTHFPLGIFNIHSPFTLAIAPKPYPSHIQLS